MISLAKEDRSLFGRYSTAVGASDCSGLQAVRKLARKVSIRACSACGCAAQRLGEEPRRQGRRGREPAPGAVNSLCRRQRDRHKALAPPTPAGYPPGGSAASVCCLLSQHTAGANLPLLLAVASFAVPHFCISLSLTSHLSHTCLGSSSAVPSPHLFPA